MAGVTTPVPEALNREQREALAHEGYVLLRRAIPADLVAAAQTAFDAGHLASNEWPVPRGADWRHAQVDLDPAVQRLCRLPALLDGMARIIGGPFFLAQVEGREPCRGNRAQNLHRDGSPEGASYAAAMAWLDPFGPANGATQVVPGSHLDPALGGCQPVILEGEAGDLLLLDPNLLHGATSNTAGARRRSLLISYAAIETRADHAASATLRGVRMDTDEVFAGPG